MALESGYWRQTATRRLGRRRTLGIFGGAAGAGAFALACGGGSTSEQGGSSSTSGQPAQAGAQEQPRAGGIINQRLATDPPSLDLHLVTTYAGVWPAAPCLNQLVQFHPDKAGDRPEDIVADLAEKWEQPDATTMVFTLKKGVKFHGGSDFTSEDPKVQLEWIKKPPQGKTSPRAGRRRRSSPSRRPTPTRCG
jgi:peptide/nickel transport system substrate-binding protein